MEGGLTNYQKYEVRLMILQSEERINKRMIVLLNNELKKAIKDVIKDDEYVKEKIIEIMSELGKDNFEPVFVKIYQVISERLTKKINKQLERVISLKTSTISEIRTSIVNEPNTEEAVLEKLRIDFPEYYSQITNKIEHTPTEQ